MVHCRSASSVSRLIPEGPQRLCFYSRSLVGPAASEKELWNLHHLYGASLRDLIKFAHQPNIYDAMVDKATRRLSPSDFTKLLRIPEDVVDGCHLLISTGPLPTGRATPERKVVSAYVLEKICEQVFKNRVKEIKNLYQTLQDRPTTATAVEMLSSTRCTGSFGRRGLSDPSLLFPRTGVCVLWVGFVQPAPR